MVICLSCIIYKVQDHGTKSILPISPTFVRSNDIQINQTSELPTRVFDPRH